MSEYYNVGDRVTPKKDHVNEYWFKGKVYEVVVDPEDGSHCIIDELGDYLYVRKSDFNLVEAAQVVPTEISVTRSESFFVAVQGHTLTLTREEAQKLLDKLSGALKCVFEDESVPSADIVIKEPLGVKIGDRYPELPAEITEFRNEFGDFLREEGVLAEYVENSRMGHHIPIRKSDDYISCAFTWRNTKQDDDFWNKLDNKWYNKLNELRNG